MDEFIYSIKQFGEDCWQINGIIGTLRYHNFTKERAIANYLKRCGKLDDYSN